MYMICVIVSNIISTISSWPRVKVVHVAKQNSQEIIMYLQDNNNVQTWPILLISIKI